jgi:hypothetical protein
MNFAEYRTSIVENQSTSHNLVYGQRGILSGGEQAGRRCRKGSSTIVVWKKGNDMTQMGKEHEKLSAGSFVVATAQ